MSAPLRSRLADALALHQHGRLDQARSLYETILEAEPRNFQSLHLLGVLAAQTGNPQEALEWLDRALAVDARNPTTHFNRGVTLHQLGRPLESLDSYQRASAIQPDYADAHYNSALVQAQLGQWQAALGGLNRVLQLRPNHAEAHDRRGAVLRQLGRLEEALASHDRSLDIEPANAGAHFKRGLVLQQMGRWAAALASYDRAIAANPQYAEAHCNRAAVASRLRRPQAALADYDRAIALKPDFAEAYSGRGAVLQELAQPEAALRDYDRAIAIQPECAEAHSNRGNVLRELGQPAAALASCDRAIALDPDNSAAHLNSSAALEALDRLDEALASCERAIALEPRSPAAHLNRGALLQKLSFADEALASYDRAIELDPQYAAAYYNRATVLTEQGNLEVALASCNKGIELKADYAEAHVGRAAVLRQLSRWQEAAASFDEALAINPQAEFVLGQSRTVKMQLCDWQGMDSDVQELTARIGRGEAAAMPFALLALSESGALHQQAARIWVRKKCPPDPSLGVIPRRPRPDKLRIGYFSADFRNHPVSFLTADLFEAHDRARFEIVAFAFGPDTQDEMRQRLTSAFDRFIDVGRASDRDIARLSRSLDIDIAVDLGGFTKDSRPNIFALRAAPLQLSYIGYLGTMGAPYIDYLLADRTLVSPDNRQHFDERIIYLPTYQVNGAKRRFSDKTFTREELGLPHRGFVFCCFNASYKILPRMFAAWMRILQSVPGSVLWLLADCAAVADNLRREAGARGVDPLRLVFGRRLPNADYLARFRAADLFLDTLPYNAGTTASDALWAGLPVLTVTGETFASRIAASLLRALHLPELIAGNLAEYERLAVELAADPMRHAGIRHRLSESRLTSRLFDVTSFTHSLEQAYRSIDERYRAGRDPEDMRVEPAPWECPR